MLANFSSSAAQALGNAAKHLLEAAVTMQQVEDSDDLDLTSSADERIAMALAELANEGYDMEELLLQANNFVTQD